MEVSRKQLILSRHHFRKMQMVGTITRFRSNLFQKLTYHFKYFKGCLPQILLGSSSKILTQIHMPTRQHKILQLFRSIQMKKVQKQWSRVFGKKVLLKIFREFHGKHRLTSPILVNLQAEDLQDLILRRNSYFLVIQDVRTTQKTFFISRNKYTQKL